MLALSTPEDLYGACTERSKELRMTFNLTTPEHLRNISTDGRIPWILDTEFLVIPDAQPVVFAISIRDIAGNIVLSTSIDYKGITLQQL
jgi:hypothetical protein